MCMKGSRAGEQYACQGHRCRQIFKLLLHARSSQKFTHHAAHVKMSKLVLPKPTPGLALDHACSSPVSSGCLRA